MAAQAEGVEVAGGVFGGGECGRSVGSFVFDGTFARPGLVMAGGGDEVAIARVEIEVIEVLESGEGIWLGPAHVDLDLSEDFTEQRESAHAFEAFEKGRAEDIGVVAIREILEKIAPALEKSETAADASFEPKFVRQGGTVAPRSGETEKEVSKIRHQRWICREIREA